MAWTASDFGIQWSTCDLEPCGNAIKDVANKLSTIRSTMERGKGEHAVDTAGKAQGAGYCFTNMSVILITTRPSFE